MLKYRDKSKPQMWTHERYNTYFYSLHSSGFRLLEPCCRGLLLFRHKSISEVQRWCWVIRSGSRSVFQFNQKVSDRAEVRTVAISWTKHTKYHCMLELYDFPLLKLKGTNHEKQVQTKSRLKNVDTRIPRQDYQVGNRPQQLQISSLHINLNGVYITIISIHTD